jgi:hypothetical protein
VSVAIPSGNLSISLELAVKDSIDYDLSIPSKRICSIMVATNAVSLYGGLHNSLASEFYTAMIQLLFSVS